MLSTSVVVLDFETTGLSPRAGDRITEVAALRVRNGRIVERYVTLVNAGVRIPSFITGLTGITNAMVASAPHATHVIADLVNFLADDIVVAHNASFDHGFLVADHLGVRIAGSAHRAEADARVAVDVLLKLAGRVAADHSIAVVDPDLLRRVTRWSAREAPTRLRRALQNRLVRPRVSDDLAHGVFRDNRAGVTRTTSTVKPLIPKRHETQRPPELDRKLRTYQGRRWRFDRRL